MKKDRWVIVRETVLDVGTDGKPELGYALLADAATFPDEASARAVMQNVGLPLGWVLMPVSRLLPGLYEV